MDNYIDLSEVIKVLWTKKLKILITTFLFSLVAIFYSLSIDNVYRSYAILAGSQDSENSLTSNLASLAGISNEGTNSTDKGLEILKSFKFFENFIENNDDLLVGMIATDHWDRKKNKLVIDNSIYDKVKMSWKKEPPTSQQSHRYFLSKLNFERTEKGFIMISFDHLSPHFASKFLEKLIFEINESSRKEDMEYSLRSISYLEKEIRGTNFVEVKTTLNNILKEEIQKSMAANATPEYLFKVLSPPFAPEIKHSPNRKMICIAFFFLGFLLSCLYVLIKNHYHKLSISNS
tara:strand:+ start:68 stop:937 length:870 start_codon:yes stop_codon:yes gene_type:complete